MIQDLICSLPQDNVIVILPRRLLQSSGRDLESSAAEKTRLGTAREILSTIVTVAIRTFWKADLDRWRPPFSPFYQSFAPIAVF